MEFYCVTIQMKAIKKYFLVLPSVILNNSKKKQIDGMNAWRRFHLSSFVFSSVLIFGFVFR